MVNRQHVELGTWMLSAEEEILSGSVLRFSLAIRAYGPGAVSIVPA